MKQKKWRYIKTFISEGNIYCIQCNLSETCLSDIKCYNNLYLTLQIIIVRKINLKTLAFFFLQYKGYFISVLYYVVNIWKMS